MSKENNVTTIACKEAIVKLDKAHMLQLDGELIGEVDKFSGRIITSAVQLVTTRKNPFVK